MNSTGGTSLRQRLLVRLWAPLFLLLMLGAMSAFGLARHIGSVVYDHWLFDSAMTLARQVRFENGRATLDLSKQAIEMFEWDSTDNIFEEVISQKHGRLFGNATFPVPPGDLIAGEAHFYDGLVNGKPARVVAVLALGRSPLGDTAIIQVAETLHKRASLLSEIWLIVVPLQALILIIAGASVWIAVSTSLRAVNDIAERLANYSPDGLVPIGDVAHAPTEVRPLLDSINRLIGKLVDAQVTQHRFIANAAHQLRTPLTTLQVQTERAMRESDPIKQGEALTHVMTAVTRSRHLAHQLLTLARSERSNEQMLKMVNVNLTNLAKDELAHWADAAIARQIDLGYDGPEQNVWIQAEPQLLRELISNLVDNAIRYGRSGGQVTLRLAIAPTVMSVDDDGTGIPAEERELVLERFYRRLGALGDGCGLGLSIANEIAARHGADLIILVSPGGGTRVQITFVS